MKYHGPTDSAAGICLVEKAKSFGYSERDRAVPGRTLRNWMGGESVPQWAVKTMVRYVLSKGYVPDSDEELDALLVYLLVDVSDDEVNDVLSVTGLSNLNPNEVESALGRIIRHA
ncbi:hypothetical protein PSH47_16250 [Pseudoalteromonas sp. CST5]|uniref:hypothetical protein n=1 Tax=unclassified Pseudoalteromonas TaxID=194690 RepID=UPI002359C816|nr:MULTISPECIES: hypothetical protein [unclassified Pseudoalteromonas]MDC9514433.1 hypothetical protein [Pseudoalteromonas sp. CST1]MDC9538879.1 hypothetical protein [Pseudoalteromonas sp. CST3]MDC9543094.1 hypothetical protein [Pseudoalteromonas sp. CST2]MDC9545912.1 hypothetical protein [Pseudoalteromonas sp. CST4]MDC9550687.1 hypothetical protein [Pseudoalteromonas sp. CST5]